MRDYRSTPTGGSARRAVLCLASTLALLLALIPYAWPRSTAAAKQLTLGFVLPDLQNPIFVPMRVGAQDAAKKLGFNLRLVGPQPAGVQGQIALIQDLAQQKVDGLVVVPSDATALNTAINDAITANITVATANLDTVGSKRAFYYGPNARKEGELEAQRVLGTLHGRGARGTVNYIVTSCLPSVTGQLERRAGFETFVKTRNSYSRQFQMKEIGFFNTSTDPAKNLSNIQNIYTAKRDAQVIYAMCAPDTENWGKVLMDHGDHRLLVAGHDWLPGTLDLIGQGWIPWSLGESPYDMGYSSLKLIYDHLANGKHLPTGIIFAKSVFCDKSNLAQIRKSPDARGS